MSSVSSRIRFERIIALADEDDNGVEMETVFATEIGRERASETLIMLNSKYPLPEHLTHVKRIWRQTDGRLLLLLAPHLGEMLAEDWQTLFPETCISVREVPKRMPRDRDEYLAWRLHHYWPTTFHEPKMRLREEAAELDLVSRIGVIVVPRLLQCPHSLVIIVNPLTCDNEASWIMSCNCLNNYNNRGDNVDNPGNHGNSPGDHKEHSEQHESTPLAKLMSPLDEPVMRAINTMAERHRTLVFPKEGPIPYLCTGLLAFCRDEPSLMSAMALVHSRIRTVVFVRPDSLRGALLSRLCLQNVPETNHHFSVFRCLMDQAHVNDDNLSEPNGL